MYVIEKYFGIKPSMYVYCKIEENFPNSTYNRTCTYNRNLTKSTVPFVPHLRLIAAFVLRDF